MRALRFLQSECCTCASVGGAKRYVFFVVGQRQAAAAALVVAVAVVVVGADVHRRFLARAHTHTRARALGRMAAVGEFDLTQIPPV
jgi:hypothetical protein